jgi:hypothetical protein
MAERDGQLGTDVETDIDLPGEVTDDPSAPDRARTPSRARRVAGSVVSGRGRGLAVSLAGVTAGILLVGWTLPLGIAGNFLGVALGAFVYGVGSQRRHYAEVGLAGTVAGVVSVLLGNLVLSLVGAGLPMAVFGAVAGALAAVVGHYLGRDLRDGLTRDL